LHLAPHTHPLPRTPLYHHLAHRARSELSKALTTVWAAHALARANLPRATPPTTCRTRWPAHTLWAGSRGICAIAFAHRYSLRPTTRTRVPTTTLPAARWHAFKRARLVTLRTLGSSVFAGPFCTRNHLAGQTPAHTFYTHEREPRQHFKLFRRTPPTATTLRTRSPSAVARETYVAALRPGPLGVRVGNLLRDERDSRRNG